MADFGGANNADSVEVVGGDGHGPQGGGGHGRLTWTSVMSGFILRRFSDLVGEGVKTDKGFKEVHLNAVAAQLCEFANVEVTGTQVYNHLRKWRAKWVKICRLRELSGALWDEDNYMISLDDDHYNGHVNVTYFINSRFSYLCPMNTLTPFFKSLLFTCRTTQRMQSTSIPP